MVVERTLNFAKSILDLRPMVREFFIDEGYQLTAEDSMSFAFRWRRGILRRDQPGERRPANLDIELKPIGTGTQVRLVYRVTEYGRHESSSSPESNIWDEEAAALRTYVEQGIRYRPAPDRSKPSRNLIWVVLIAGVALVPMPFIAQVRDESTRTVALVIVVLVVLSLLIRYRAFPK